MTFLSPPRLGATMAPTPRLLLICCLLLVPIAAQAQTPDSTGSGALATISSTTIPGSTIHTFNVWVPTLTIGSVADASAMFRNTFSCHCRSRSLVETGNEMIFGAASSHAMATRCGLPASMENVGNARTVVFFSNRAKVLNAMSCPLGPFT